MQVFTESRVPVKAWVDGVELEDEAKKQLLNVAQLPFVYKHVAVMPDCHWGIGATIGSVIPTLGAIVPASVGVDLGCFVGDTTIVMLGGERKSFSELAEKDESFWVYSIDSNLKLAPGRAICKKTRDDAELICVTISTGDEIICTPDHKFMILGGEYCQANTLLGKTLMALRPNFIALTVTGIKVINYREDVYCLEVEEHHNFALGAGVFVHNCGMTAIQTSLTASNLPDNLSGVRSAVEAAVPHGRTTGQDRGAWGNVPELSASSWDDIDAEYKTIISKYSKIEPKTHPSCHLGTLGGGNHFIELCLDENQNVWVMLHSGSRGIGNKIGTFFIEKAREEMEKWHITPYLPDKDLAYLPEHTELFDDYVKAVHWAQDFAARNRALMLHNILKVLKLGLGDFQTDKMAIACHHNYISREHHFGQNVWVTRKGAVRARQDEYGIIPGSMGAKSFIVRGKGNEQSFHSCSHGAGRRMSRKKAKDLFSLADHAVATQGVECRKDADVIDETPGAYKSIDAVMAAQADLVDIVHTLKQVLRIKG